MTYCHGKMFWLRRCFFALGLAIGLSGLPKAHAEIIDMPGAVSDLPETRVSFSELYQENRELAIGDYITFDLVAHGVTRLWHDSIHSYETETVQPLLAALIQELQTALAAQADTPITQANRDYAQVLAALLEGSSAELSVSAQAELALIKAAEGPAESPIFAYRLDYSQFKPRAAYEQSEARRRFFRSYRYAASTLFPLRPSAALGLNDAQQQRLLEQLDQLVQLFETQPAFAAKVQALQTAVYQFFPGRASGVPLAWLHQQLTASNIDRATAITQLLAKTRHNGMQPEVLYGLVNSAALPSAMNEQDALTGFRLVPVLESMANRVFQGLVYDSTGAWQGQVSSAEAAPEQPKGLGSINGVGPAKVRPLLDEFIALLGVPLLQTQLAQTGEQAFTGYDECWARLQQSISQLDGTEALRVSVFQQYLASHPQGWVQQVETIKGMWTELAHAEALYQAQSNTVMGKGIGIAKTDSAARGATIEAVPDAFQGLIALGSGITALSSPTLSARWEEMNQVLQQASELAQKVLDNTTLSAEDEAFLRGMPGQLDRIAGQPSVPLIIDIHTGTDGQRPEIVYAATGFVREQVIKQQEKLYRGARYRYYGFAQTGSKRLTDTDWNSQLKQAYSKSLQTTWRHKVAPTLLHDWVLARAQNESDRASVTVYLARDLDKDLDTALNDWLQQNGLANAARIDSTLMLHLPLHKIEELARHRGVKRIEPQTALQPLAPDLVL